MQNINKEMEIRFFTYGSNFNDVVFIDNSTLSKIDKLINSPSEYYLNNKIEFIDGLIEISNFVDLFCLQDSLYYSETDWIFDSEKLLQITSRNTFHITKNIQNNILLQINPFTIDDIQKDRVFDRWKMTNLIDKDKDNSSFKIKRELYKGLLLEELTGIPYFPTTENIIPYIKGTPVEFDLRLHNLLIDAYCSITKSSEVRRNLKSSINGIMQPNIPPLLSLILSKISNKDEFIEELQIWRDKFSPFRNKIREQRNLANSNINDEKWLKDYNLLNKDIELFTSNFNIVDRRIELSKTSATDTFEIFEKIETKDISYSYLPKQLINLGIEPLKRYLINRRIQPLPDLKQKLFNIHSLKNEIKKIWDIEFDIKDINYFDSRVREAFKLYGDFNNKSNQKKYFFNRVNEFRKGFESIVYSEIVNFNVLLEEFTILQKYRTDKGRINIFEINEIALLYFYHNRIESAHKILLLGEKFFPEHIKVFAHAFSLVLIKINKPEAARKYLELIQDFDPFGAYNNELATTYMQQNFFLEAIPYLKKAIDIYKNHREALTNLATCHYQLKNYQLAIKNLNLAYKLDRTEPILNLLMARCFSKTDKKFKALKHIKIALMNSKYDKPCLKDIAALCFENKFYAYGISALETLLICEYKEEYYNFLCSMLYLNSNYIKVINVVKRKPIHLEKSEADYSFLGYSYYELKLHDKAISNFWKANKLSSHNNYLKHISEIIYKYNTIIKSNDLLQSKTSNAYINFILGQHFFALNNYSKALSYFSKAYSNGYVEKEKFYNYGVKLDRLKDYKNAIQLYKYELSISSEDAKCHSNIAVDYLEEGDVQNAVTHAEKSVLLSPSDPINLINLASIYISNRENNKAKNILNKIISMRNKFSSEILSGAKLLLDNLNK